MSQPIEEVKQAPQQSVSFLRRTFQAFHFRDFRLMWIGACTSQVGTQIQTAAQSWTVLQLSHNSFYLGVDQFLGQIPVAVLALLAGVLADRRDRRRVLLGSQYTQLACAFIMAALAFTGVLKVWQIWCLSFVVGTAQAFGSPSYSALIPTLVPKEHLPNAIALNSAAFNTARVVGPAIAGALVAAVGESWCFVLNAISYLFVIAMLLRMDLPRRLATPADRSTTLREGIRYARATGPIRNLLLLLGVTCGLGFQYMILLPVYADHILKSGPKAYGLMVAAFGLGSLGSAVVMTRRLDRWALRRNLLIGLGVSGVSMAVFAWSRALPLTLAMGLGAGFGLILYVASTNVMLQLTTEDRFRGRVMSLYTFMFVGTAPLGSLLAGWVAQKSGAPIATTVCAGILLCGAGWVMWRLRVLAEREAADVSTDGLAEKLG